MSRNVGDTFREEAQELLGELEIALIELEESPLDQDAVGRVFRALHTLKGSGAMAGFEAVAAVAHEFESVFERVRSGELEASRELVSRSLQAGDRLKAMIEAGPGPAADAEAAQLLAGFGAYGPDAGGVETAASAELFASTPSSDATTIRIRFRPQEGIFRRGINPVALLREVSQLGDCRVVAQVDAIPPLAELDPESCHLYWDIILTTDAGINAIRDVFIFVEDDCELKIEVLDVPDEREEYRRLGEILVERGDIALPELQAALAARRRIGEELVIRGFVDGCKVDSALAEQEQVEKIRRERQTQEVADTIRVRSEKLDALVDLVGELVTVQARLSRAAGSRADAELAAIAEAVERLTWDLRDQVLNVRMLPIGTTFSKFRRLVRDLSETLGKDVELLAEGADTELDKTVIDRLYEPLVHLIRNGIDHGIEPPEVRRAAGKPARGRIRLTASHSGPNVVVRISDDGRGLDLEAIRRRAVESGLIAAAAELSEKELAALAFHPGLSTAAAVTSISGRGVGMDVVKRAIDALRGSIDVLSRPGKGTTFSVKLPLTLAIIDGLLVRLGDDHFVLPLSAVEECVELKRADAEFSRGRNLVRVRGEIVPFVRLREQFRIEGEAPQIEQVVIVEADRERVGFVVDHVVGEHQTVIKGLGRLYREVTGLSGATILGDGTVALILDIPQLVSSVERQEKAEGQSLENIFRRGSA